MKRFLLGLMLLLGSMSYAQEIELYTESFIMNGDTILTENPYSILMFTLDFENSMFIQNNIDGNEFRNTVKYKYIKDTIQIKDGNSIVILELDKDTNTFVMRSNFNAYYIGNYEFRK